MLGTGCVGIDVVAESATARGRGRQGWSFRLVGGVGDVGECDLAGIVFGSTGPRNIDATDAPVGA